MEPGCPGQLSLPGKGGEATPLGKVGSESTERAWDRNGGCVLGTIPGGQLGVGLGSSASLSPGVTCPDRGWF